MLAAAALNPVCQRRPDRGLSVIELLVVIAIISLLIGLLLPALSGLRATSKAAQCSNQLRQLAIAAETYRNVFDGCYPPALLYEWSPGGLVTVAWDFVQKPGGVIEPGPLWRFTDDPGEAMQDPAFTGHSTFGSDPFTGFNYNTTYIGAEGRYPELGPDGSVLDGWEVCRMGVPPAALRKQATTALFGLGGWSGGANKFMRAPMNTVEGDLALVYAGGQAFRHGGATLVAYLDGHVGSVAQPREGVLATAALLKSTMDFPDNGFLTNDDAAYDPR